MEVKSGIRTFRLPKGEKPELHEDNLRTLEQYISRADRSVLINRTCIVCGLTNRFIVVADLSNLRTT